MDRITCTLNHKINMCWVVGQTCLWAKAASANIGFLSTRDLALFDIYEKLFEFYVKHVVAFLVANVCYFTFMLNPIWGISACICMNVSRYIWNENCKSDCGFVPSNLEVCSLTMFTWDLNIFQDIQAWLLGLTWIM